MNGLHLASKEGHINVVLELLARAASVDSSTKVNHTELFIAPWVNHSSMYCINLGKDRDTRLLKVEVGGLKCFPRFAKFFHICPTSSHYI